MAVIFGFVLLVALILFLRLFLAELGLFLQFFEAEFVSKTYQIFNAPRYDSPFNGEGNETSPISVTVANRVNH